MPKSRYRLYELLSKLLVSPLISPIVVPYIIPYITPFKEFRLWLICRLFAEVFLSDELRPKEDPRDDVLQLWISPNITPIYTLFYYSSFHFLFHYPYITPIYTIFYYSSCLHDDVASVRGSCKNACAKSSRHAPGAWS